MKAVMVIAHRGFRDEELFETKQVLESAGIEVKVASTATTPAQGARGGKACPDMLLSDIKTGDFDAFVLVGGAGSSCYWDDPLAHRLSREAFEAGKVVAAICIAPVTLAKAGLLKGRRATVWASESGQLVACGARYTGKPVEKDGLLITASGPQAAKAFGEEIVKALCSE